MRESLGVLIRGERPEAILAREQKIGAELEYSLDEITSRIVLHALSGARVTIVTRKDRLDELVLPILQDAERARIAEVFDSEAQQRRGAWFLPEDGAVRTGYANLPFHFAQYPRFASGAVRDDAAKPLFAEQPEALYFWAVLDRLFFALFTPVVLRGPDPPKVDAEASKETWTQIDETYAALGIDGGEPLSLMRYGGGWSRLRAHDQLAVKQKLIAHLRRIVPSNIGARYRAWSSSELVERYYAKAKHGGQPLMRQVLTKPLQRTLVAFYGGDWLAFLRYLGEAPNPAEQIATALPEPRLYVDAAARVVEVAERHGLPTEEIERMLASYWQTPSADTPIHQRVNVFREFWKLFDTIHAQQKSGMDSLWGLVEEGEFIWLQRDEAPQPEWFHPGLYRKLLPAALLTEVNELWGAEFLPAHPDAIVSAIDPYARMNLALGPALRFWNGAALTAWFVSEGPSSRTDMRGLARYHRHDVVALESLGCPIPHTLFTELIAAEKKLGPPQPISEDVEEDDKVIEAGGISVRLAFSTSRGSRRAGFERLRDILTLHRRAWAAQFLEKYLRALWETQLRDTAREFNRLYEVKRKAPTVKQFAKCADRVTNEWFGGDISLFYRAIGEKSPLSPARKRILREDASTFARRVFAAIGGKPTRWEDLAATIEGNDRARQDAAWRAHQGRERLAGESIHYVQLREALGRPPTLKEFGLTKFVFYAPLLDGDLIEKWGVTDYGSYVLTHRNTERAVDAQRAWERYSAAIEKCLESQGRRRTSES